MMSVVVPLEQVDVVTLPVERLRSLIGDTRFAELASAAAKVRASLGDRTVWNVNSTAAGGGVAEMLKVLVGYTRGTGLDVRWLVIHGDARFFAITKRIHNRIHGAQGDDGALGEAEAAHYREVMAANADALLELVHPGDVVLLHDPQTAGLADAVSGAGAHVVWRCHIGADHRNEWTEQAWRFLSPFLSACEAFVFSRRAYVPPEIDEDLVSVIPPSIDPFSPKNQDMSDDMRARIIRRVFRVGPEAEDDDPVGTFVCPDGHEGHVVRSAAMIVEAALLDPSKPLVVQVSRWDRLKDMRGVMLGFEARVVGRVDADLILVGPSVEGVTDDPEGAEVLAECVSAWQAMPEEPRRHIHLVTLPMDDVDENAAMVNAIQRQVVASAVGGIVDQVASGTGILLDNPEDLDAFGDAVAGLLERPADILQLGANANWYVLDNFLGDRHLLRYAGLIERLVAG